MNADWWNTEGETREIGNYLFGGRGRCWLSRLESIRDILIGGKERDYEFAELKTKL